MNDEIESWNNLLLILDILNKYATQQSLRR